MDDLKQDTGSSNRYSGYVNPIYLMAHSGARGGVEQIRQLAGMRGLMAKPSGKIIETPIKANFRLFHARILQFYSRSPWASDTALKTADSGTHEKAEDVQNVIWHNARLWFNQGIEKTVIYRAKSVNLVDSIRGRVSRTNITNPITDEVVVEEDQLITPKLAREIEALDLRKFRFVAHFGLRVPLGVCRLRYGMDLSTGSLVEEGMAVGIISSEYR